MSLWRYVSPLLPPSHLNVDEAHEAHPNPNRSFRNLQPRSRMYVGVGIMAYSALGLAVSSKAEEKFGMVPTEKDREKLRDVWPKIMTVEGD